MKRKLLSLILIMALVASLVIGCGEASNNNTTGNNTENTDNTPTNNDINDDEDNDNEDEEEDQEEIDANYPYEFHLSYATDDVMAQYSDYSLIVGHDTSDSVKILITADVELKDLKFYTLEFADYDQDLNQPIYNKTFVGEVSSLTKDKPIVFQMSFGEVFASAGFSYVDADGVTHMIGISMSGLNGNPIPGTITE
ncbi:MAG: hypothetical protein J5876_04930 [Lachnospiraceae bacterium]|nr:hypothetical protein [Lachnospiraceae bacterium]MBO4462221.1 hypothetical protein [Lachnospiraceae bacterium]MBR4795201.1 hypothetical protein [Lachnospiraceae bacterium]